MKNDQKKNAKIIIAVLVVFICALVGTVVVFSNSSSRKLEKQLNLAQHYLEELNYEQAIASFEFVLSIDPMNAEAYLGLAEVYIRNNGYDEAFEIANKGYELTGGQGLQRLIDMIESGNIYASNGWTMKNTTYDGAGAFLYSHEYTYNKKGQIVSVIWRDSTEEIKDTIELKYDDEGNTLVGFGFNVDSGELTRNEYVRSGNTYTEYVYFGNGSEIGGVYEGITDNDGRLLEETAYDKDGNFNFKYVMDYDSKGRSLKDTFYMEDGSVSRYNTYEYATDGLLQKRSFYNGDGKLGSYLIYEHDENGKLIREIEYNADGTIIRTTEY